MTLKLSDSMRNRLMRSLIALVALLLMSSTSGAADPEPAQGALDTFDFASLRLPTTVARLKELLPSVKQTEDKRAEKAGLTCYVAKNFKAADEARFYFVQDGLYQVELEYKPAKVDSLGGINAVMRKLVDGFGPALHVDLERRSWVVNSSRRVDFYFTRDPALLVITETLLEGEAGQRPVPRPGN